MKYGNRILLTNIKENDIIEDLRIYSEDLNQIKDERNRSSFKAKPNDSIATLTQNEQIQIFKFINRQMSGIISVPFLSNGESALSITYNSAMPAILSRAKDKEEKQKLQTEIYNLLFNPRNYAFILGQIFSGAIEIGDGSLYKFGTIFEKDFYQIIRSKEVTEMIKSSPGISAENLYQQIKSSPSIDPFYKTAEKMGFQPFVGFVVNQIEKYLSR